MTEKKLPTWLAVTADNATITLSRAIELNGVRCDRLVLRTPTIGDMRHAARLHKDDKEAQEIQLFANLAECSPADIERLSMRDYGRVQEGYFRLVADDTAA